VSAHEVQRRLLGEPPHERSVPRPPETPLVMHVRSLQRCPHLPGLSATVFRGSGDPGERQGEVCPEQLPRSRSHLLGAGPAHRAVLRQGVGRYAQDLEKSYIATVKVLAAAIDARDSYTLGHSTRVAQLSMQLAGEIGLDKEKLEELEIACLFHDVGKIRIPDAILHKRGTLDLPERQEMMRHTEYGTEILEKAPSLHKFIPAVRHHHEWHDGSGYPDGLSGDKIPLPASIISLADAFDAMTSNRPYRRAMTKDEALRQISELSGKQFNPDLVQSFLAMIEGSGRSVPPVGGQG